LTPGTPSCTLDTVDNEHADTGISENGSAGMTRLEFARLARVHPDTVKRWARLGIGPRPRKLGPRLVRYDRGEVLAYVRGGRRQESA
jgi:hypothetical protein